MKRPILLIMILPALALIFSLLVWPLALLFVSSVQSTGNAIGAAPGRAGLSLSNYVEILTDPWYFGALVNSLWLSFSVAALSILLCLGPAWLLVRGDFPGKSWIRALFTLPMSFSGVIVGFLVVIMLGRIGFIPQFMESLTGRAFLSGSAYQFTGLLVAYIYFEVPRALLTLESSLKKFDFQLETAARSLGAGRWQRFFWVVLPNLWPALLSTFSLTFCVSLGSFGVALIISKRFALMPVEIFQQFTGFLNTGLASAMCIVLVAIAFTVNYGLRMLSGRREVPSA